MRRTPLPGRARFGVFAIALVLLGCSRALPDPPPTSPLTPDSAAARPLAVDVALRSEPPLPGKAGKPGSGEWSGLSEPSSAGGHDHHGHHGHHQPASEPASEPAKGGEHVH